LKKRNFFGNFNISENNLISVEAAKSKFFLADFSQFVKNISKKHILSQIPYFCQKVSRFLFIYKKLQKNRHNCLQYKRVLKIFYFHTLTIAKFG